MSDNEKSCAKPNRQVIFPVYNERGEPTFTFYSQRSELNAKVYCKVPPDRAIPVIFLPGVMGSNLKSKRTGYEGSPSNKLWRLDSPETMAGWLSKGPKDRKDLLHPDQVLVDNEGEVLNNYQESPPVGAFLSREQRGWGEVGAMSYGEFLHWLQEALHDFIWDKPHPREREQLVKTPPGLEHGDNTLTSKEVMYSFNYYFPVHAVGYNWLDSNKASAKRVVERIDEIIDMHKQRGLKCEKVILVTHSMGGLVARYCSEIEGARDKILGIVHAVIPALGAAAAYRRMKAGTERGRFAFDKSKSPEDNFFHNIGVWATPKILGEDAAEMTAVLAQSPGPLQLLPGTAYGMGWLRIQDGNTSYSLPKSDPFTEIYTVRGKWWSLCQDHLINPENVWHNRAVMDADWDNYAELINEHVKPVINDLNGKYHPHTHAFYGTGTPTHHHVTWKSIALNTRSERSLAPTRHVMEASTLDSSTERGRYRTVATPRDGEGRHVNIQTYRIVPPGDNDEGDGTVPVFSAQIPTACLRSRMSLPADHEGAYKEKEAQRYTLWAIMQLMQRIKLTSLRVPDDD